VTPVLLQLAVAGALAAGGGGLELPEPEAPEPVVIEEVGESPTYYRLPRDTLLIGLRTGVGVSRRLTESVRPGATALGLELHAVAAVAHRRGSRLALLADAGYGYASYRAHWGSFGAGPMVRGLGAETPFSASEVSLGTPISIAMLPQLLAGSVEGRAALGVRGTVVVSFGVYGLGLSYLRASAGNRPIHELRLMLASMTFWGPG
jgi:hypothetical protein